MYLPYFRGRQYELLALRELADNKLLGSKVIPIIEPIKISATFTNTLEAYTKAKLPIGLIFNPAKGDLPHDDKAIPILLPAIEGKSVIPSVLVNKRSNSCLQAMKSKGISAKETIAVLNKRDSLEFYETMYSSEPPRLAMFPDERKFFRAVKGGKILFDDRFIKQARNADYPDDEFFSDDHLYYEEYGYQGFGDYSMVGSEYTESAFAPYAVAIHIIYFDKEKALRIRHFVSDSNEDISDVAGKFSEAVSKLSEWYKSVSPRQSTRGLQILLKHHSQGTYPGLPTLKKLSIMHHLELMGMFLEGELEI